MSYSLKIIWGSFYLLGFAALMLQISRHRPLLEDLTSILDALAFSVGIAALGWKNIPALALVQATSPLSDLVSVSWPLGDLLLVFATVSLMIQLMIQLPQRRLSISRVYLVAGFAVKIAADNIYDRLGVAGAFEVMHFVHPVWVVSYVLMGLAALSETNRWPAGEMPRERGHSSSPGLSCAARVLMPYLALPAAGLLIYSHFREASASGRSGSELDLAISLTLIGLMMLRQLLTVVENYRLSASLAGLSRDLEVRVAERTEELSNRTTQLEALNQVAMQLSLCLTSSEVLTSGLALVCKATGHSRGAIWLRKPDGGAEMGAQCGLSSEAQSQLADLVEQSPILAQALTIANPTRIQWSDLPLKRSFSDADGSSPECLLVIPLLSRRTVLGAISLISAHEHECNSVDLHLSQAIGAELGVALENARRYDEMKRLADRDPVTGLLNHRAIHERLGQELKRTQRAGQQLSVIMTDLDGFKLFNDTHGHPVGDQVLRQVAAVLAENARDSDVLGRYGGDEFVAILPETGTEGAMALAERIRSSLNQHPYAVPDGTVVPIHMSFGVATYPQDARQTHDLIALADRNLYDSKQQGGDTITAGDASGREEAAGVGTFGVLDGLVTAVDHKDHYTRRHSEHVMAYAVEIARQLGLPEENQRTLQVAGLLHDVGKIGVPDRILRKPAKLLEDEFSIVKQHALLGEMIIKEVPNLIEVLAAVGSHHERVDGQGYPRGLKGAEIPLLGRILAVADAYSAMTTDRPYRQALNAEQAKSELRRVADTQLDATVVDAFLELLERTPSQAIA